MCAGRLEGKGWSTLEATDMGCKGAIHTDQEFRENPVRSSGLGRLRRRLAESRAQETSP